MSDKPEINMLETDSYLAGKEKDYKDQITFYEKIFVRSVDDGIENLSTVFKSQILLLKDELFKIQKKRAEIAKY